MDKSVSKYIADQRALGKEDSIIQQELINSGWKPEDLQPYFTNSSSEVPTGDSVTKKMRSPWSKKRKIIVFTLLAIFGLFVLSQIIVLVVGVTEGIQLIKAKHETGSQGNSTNSGVLPQINGKLYGSFYNYSISPLQGIENITPFNFKTTLTTDHKAGLFINCQIDNLTNQSLPGTNTTNTALFDIYDPQGKFATVNSKSAVNTLTMNTTFPFTQDNFGEQPITGELSVTCSAAYFNPDGKKYPVYDKANPSQELTQTIGTLSLQLVTTPTPTPVAATTLESRDEARSIGIPNIVNQIQSTPYSYNSFPNILKTDTIGNLVLVQPAGNSYTLDLNFCSGSPNSTDTFVNPPQQSPNDTCVGSNYTFSQSGVLHTTQFATEYFYLPFQGNKFINQSDTSSVVDNYIIGACLESGKLYFVTNYSSSTSQPTLVTKISDSEIETLGVNPVTITCQ